MEPKSTKTYTLSQSTIEKINELSQKYKMTKSGVVESLVLGTIVPLDVEKKYLLIEKQLAEIKSMIVKTFMKE